MKHFRSTLKNATLLVILIAAVSMNAQERVNYDNDFQSSESLRNFEFSDKNAWRLGDSLENYYLELFGESDYSPKVRSPLNIAVLGHLNVSDFTLEVDLQQTGREYGHRDMCIFFGMQDPSNFYYVHIASVADENAHNIFIVNDKPRRNIATTTTSGIAWGTDFNKVKVIRETETGKIEVYFNDMETPIMEATDVYFKEGLIGFGSFDDTGRIDNIRMKGTYISSKRGFFK